MYYLYKSKGCDELCVSYEEFYLCVGNTETKVAIGMTHPQLGGYDYFVHNISIGIGNTMSLYRLA